MLLEKLLEVRGHHILSCVVISDNSDDWRINFGYLEAVDFETIGWYKVPWALIITDNIIWVIVGHRIQYWVLSVQEEIVHVFLEVRDYLLEIFPLTVGA